MVTQCDTPPKSGKNKNEVLPEEVSEAISEIGGLDRLLSAIKPNEIKAQANLYRILSAITRQ